MAHIRPRYLSHTLKKLLAFSPLVGILGHRQVGKTTVLEKHSSFYITLDKKSELQQALSDPELFIDKFHGKSNGIDEAQFAPGIFPALKERVRKNKIPGQFLLSGSVRFTSRKAIRESLTGRIVNAELLPFSVGELHQDPQSQLLDKLLATKDLHRYILENQLEIKETKKFKTSLEKYLRHGGLPGVCFIREESLRNSRISEQLTTILDRDLRTVYPTTIPYSQLFDFLSALSTQEGLPIKYSDLKKITGISEVTQKKLLYALESIFLIRRIPLGSGGQKGFVCYLEDQAEALFLDSQKSLQTQIEGLIYRNSRVHFNYQVGNSYRYFHYLTRSGARVPIALEKDHSILGFIPLKEDSPSRSDLASAKSFLKTYASSKIIYLSPTYKCEVLSDREIILPLTCIC
jgi:predicted AAA+ superfamily ATPase